MRLETLFASLNLHTWLESLLVDFVLAFAFFTSLIFTVLNKRFDQRRSVITMSVVIALALSLGLIGWEQANGLSIKNLGPLAIGFALIVLALAMYQAIKQVGGSWAGAGLTLAAVILIAYLLQIQIPLNTQFVQTLTGFALLVGILAFFWHSRTPATSFSKITSDPRPISDMTSRYRDRHLSDNLTRNMKKLKKTSRTLTEDPQNSGNVIKQLKRMLPAEGYLTQRMAQLRAKVHRVRNGHIARLEETKEVFARLPNSARKKAAGDLAARYQQMIGMDGRLERLDNAVAANEKQIRDLTQQAQRYTTTSDYPKLHDTLKAAEKLQHHNSKLFKLIEQAEKRLTQLAQQIAHEVKQIEK